MSLTVIKSDHRFFFQIFDYCFVFWHKADWVEYQLNPTQFGRAYSQSQLYIPLGENQNKEKVIIVVVKSWNFEICTWLTDFLDSVKKNLIHITNLRKLEEVTQRSQEIFLRWKFVQKKVRFFIFISVNFFCQFIAGHREKLLLTKLWFTAQVRYIVCRYVYNRRFSFQKCWILIAN